DGLASVALRLRRPAIVFAVRGERCPQGDPRGHDWRSLLGAAIRALDIVYVDGEAHMEAAVAYDQLGKPNEAKREQMIAVGIFKSMMPNGDGHSREHAFVVISITEEYELMAATRRRRVGSQALIHDAGHSYEMIEAAGPDAKKSPSTFRSTESWPPKPLAGPPLSGLSVRKRMDGAKRNPGLSSPTCGAARTAD
ncbi:MAG: DUF4919 domain-containing protein, partial [Bradyrhizobiaceae bacterium]|nr:DUF4919 domain-containing protein [Bradyrhizobiaceae bacterium]